MGIQPLSSLYSLHSLSLRRTIAFHYSDKTTHNIQSEPYFLSLSSASINSAVWISHIEYNSHVFRYKIYVWQVFESAGLFSVQLNNFTQTSVFSPIFFYTNKRGQIYPNEEEAEDEEQPQRTHHMFIDLSIQNNNFGARFTSEIPIFYIINHQRRRLSELKHRKI